MAQVDYSKGDYRRVADRLRPAAVELVDAAGPRPGDLARPCAERGDA